MRYIIANRLCEYLYRAGITNTALYLGRSIRSMPSSLWMASSQMTCNFRGEYFLSVGRFDFLWPANLAEHLKGCLPLLDVGSDLLSGRESECCRRARVGFWQLVAQQQLPPNLLPLSWPHAAAQVQCQSWAQELCKRSVTKLHVEDFLFSDLEEAGGSRLLPSLRVVLERACKTFSAVQFVDQGLGCWCFTWCLADSKEFWAFESNFAFEMSNGSLYSVPPCFLLLVGWIMILSWRNHQSWMWYRAMQWRTLEGVTSDARPSLTF